jgi:hypothetical protein
MGRGWGHRNGHEKHLVFSEPVPIRRRVGFTTGVCTVVRVQHPSTAFQCQAIARIVATS